MQVRVPDQILSEIVQTRHELMRGSDALYGAELAAERADDAAQLASDRVYMTAEGSIEDRKAAGRAASQVERDAAFVARAEHNRIRSKIRAMEAALVSLQAELKWAKEAGA